MDETGLELLAEVSGDLTAGEKISGLIIGAFVLIGLISAIQENRPNNPEDIPTNGQINEKKEQIAKLEGQLKSMKSGTISGENADLWRKKTEEALEHMEKLRHELFAPGEVKQIRQALQDAEDFREKGHQEAANTALYQAWQLARKTEECVLQAEKEWEEAAVAYLTAHGSMQLVLDNTSEMPVEFTTDQGKETLPMDADFWSQGRVSALQKTLPEEELPRDLTVEQVQQRIQQIRALAQELEQAITVAVEDFQISQQRMELCEAIYEFFADRGWALDETAENGFEKQDPRKDILLNLYSAAKDKLEFTFSGAGRISAKSRFRDVHNRGLMEYMEQIIRQALQENGFTVTQLASNG